MPLEDAYDIEVIGEVVPLEDIFRSVPQIEEPILRMTRVGEIGTAAWPSELAYPSPMTSPEPQEASSGTSLLLRRGESEVALGHGDFL